MGMALWLHPQELPGTGTQLHAGWGSPWHLPTAVHGHLWLWPPLEVGTPPILRVHGFRGTGSSYTDLRARPAPLMGETGTWGCTVQAPLSPGSSSEMETFGALHVGS